MQVRAIMEAACDLKKKGIDARPEIMIPLVSHINELRFVKAELEPVAKKVQEEKGVKVHYKFGTMIEIPRAALTAGEIAKDAEFSVTIRTEKRSVQPGPLTPSVLGAGRSVAIKLNDFALAGPGEKTITAEVVGKIGRVVAGSLEVGTDGVRSDPGIPAASKQWFLPVAGYPGPATLSIQDPGSRRVDLSVVDEGQDELKLASGVSGISVPAGGVLTYAAGVLPGAGVSVQAMNGVPFVLSGRVGGRNGDVATVDPVASSARRWVVPVTCPASGGQAILILLDTGRARVEVRVTAIGPEGPIPSQALASITVLPGRVVQVPLPAGPNGAPQRRRLTFLALAD
jgi:hypothetical protein